MREAQPVPDCGQVRLGARATSAAVHGAHGARAVAQTWISGPRALHGLRTEVERSC